MNKTLSEIQAELKVWTEYNFGKQESIIPIMGMIEELGELTHAHLKELQGIRKSDFLADKKDAIADITIYLLNYFNCINEDISQIEDILTDANENDSNNNIILIITTQLGIVSNNIVNTEISDINIQHLAFVLFCLKEYAENIDFNLLTIVNEVWETVKLRDWKQYPNNGMPNGYEVKLDKGIDIINPETNI